MALVVVGQMMPDGAIKGGSSMALRYGRNTRFTRDLDAARTGSLAAFRAEFEELLAGGWAGFTGRLVPKAAPLPVGVPTEYVMQPFDVKLDYRGRAWCTVKFELGHNEIGDADEPELQIAEDLAAMFTEVGIEAPLPVRVMRADHQVAQKLHALSADGSERVRDLVDLQLLDSREDLDFVLLAETCARLFAYRGQQTWPPTVSASVPWTSLYAEASEDLPVLPSVVDAVDWVIEFIRRIVASGDARPDSRIQD